MIICQRLNKKAWQNLLLAAFAFVLSISCQRVSASELVAIRCTGCDRRCSGIH